LLAAQSNNGNWKEMEIGINAENKTI